MKKQHLWLIGGLAAGYGLLKFLGSSPPAGASQGSETAPQPLGEGESTDVPSEGGSAPTETGTSAGSTGAIGGRTASDFGSNLRLLPDSGSGSSGSGTGTIEVAPRPLAPNTSLQGRSSPYRRTLSLNPANGAVVAGPVRRTVAGAVRR